MIRRGRQRTERAFRRYFRRPGRRDSCDVIVAHGNVIRYLVGRAMKLDGFRWWSLGSYHCGITLIRITSAGETVLDAYNDAGHLPLSLRTSGTVRDP
jgi:serine/threonine-protein phosphatase PGAM5